MARRSVEIDLKANSQAAVRELRRLEDAAKDADDSVEGVETAGKTMARAIEQAADDAIDEIDATKRAVDALDMALGDVDYDPRELVADLKRAGLTAEEIEADVDDLADALKRAGDVKIRARDLGFDDVDQALGRTTSNSRVTSTAIGGIGNSISELPGVGSLGPVAESMGMLAENALEGEANLKGLVVAGGGLAAVGLGVQVVQGHFQRLADIKAWEREQVDDWTDAVYEAGDAVDGVADSLRNAGMIEVRTISDGFEDITPIIARAGLTVDDWTLAVNGGREEADALALALDAAGVSSRQGSIVMQGLAFAQDAAAEATRKAAERTAVFGSEADNAAKDAAKLNTELDEIPGTYAAEIDVDTADATSSLDSLQQRLDRIIGSSGMLNSLGFGRFTTPTTVVNVPAGYTPADVQDLERRYTSRNTPT